jgi:hypothetical protein
MSDVAGRGGQERGVSGRAVTLALWAAVPMALLAAVLVCATVNIPRYACSIDPEYQYLFSSLTLAHGDRVGYHDHPGITVKLLAVPVICAVAWLRGDNDLVRSVLTNPETYLAGINAALITLYCLVLFLASVRVFNATKSVVAAVCVQCTPLFMGFQFITMMMQVRAEPVLLLTSLLLVFVIARQADETCPERPAWLAVCYGLVFGWGIMTKLTVIPLAVFPLIALRGMRAKALYCAVTVAGAVAVALPAIMELVPAMGKFGWIVNTGIRGTGKTLLVDHMFQVYLRRLVTEERPFFVILALAACTVLVAGSVRLIRRMRGRKNDAALWLRIATGMVVALSAQAFAVARTPLENYLMPSLGLSGMALASCVCTLREMLPGCRRLSGALGAVLVAAMVWMSTAHTMPKIRTFLNVRMRVKDNEQGFLKQLDRDYPAHTRVYYYLAPVQEYGLHFAMGFSFYQYGRILEELYPGRLFYTWVEERKRFVDWDITHELSIEDLAWKGNQLLLVGWRLDQAAQYRPPGNWRIVAQEGEIQAATLDTTAMWVAYQEALRRQRGGYGRWQGDLIHGAVFDARCATARAVNGRLWLDAPRGADATCIGTETAWTNYLDDCGYRCSSGRVLALEANACVTNCESITICARVCPRQAADRQVPVGQGYGTSPANSPWFFIYDTRLRTVEAVMQFTGSNNAPYEARIAHVYSNRFDQEWHHLACVYEACSNALVFYVNGSMAGCTSTPLGIRRNVMPTPLTIGGLAGGALPFEGYIRDVVVFPRGLTVDEVQQSANGGVHARVATQGHQ